MSEFINAVDSLFLAVSGKQAELGVGHFALVMACDETGTDVGKVMLGSNGFSAVEFESSGLNTNFVFDKEQGQMIEFKHTPPLAVREEDEVAERKVHDYSKLSEDDKMALVSFIELAARRIRNARQLTADDYPSDRRPSLTH